MPAALCILLVVFVVKPTVAIVNGTEPLTEDRRFDAVCALSRTSWLHAGGEDPDHLHNWFGAATLIAPDRILTAKHLLGRRPGGPKPGAFSARFRRRGDGGLGSVEEGPESFHHAKVASWILWPDIDLAVGILQQPIGHIKPIPLALEQEPLVEQTGFLAGWGSQSNWMGAASPRRQLLVGQNRLTCLPENNQILITDWRTEPRRWKQDPQTGQWIEKLYITTDLAVPNKHDSGGAILLVNEQGDLRLVGVINGYHGGAWLPPYVGSRRLPIPTTQPNTTGPPDQP